MRVLFTAAGVSPASVFAIAPLATAVRNAGHDIVMAAFGELTPTIEAVGIPPVAVVTEKTADSLKPEGWPDGVSGFSQPSEEELSVLGRWFGRQGVESLDGLLELSRHWRPDVVVGGTLDHAGPLLGLSRDIPYVRQSWDWLDLRAAYPHAVAELHPTLAGLGHDRLPEPALSIDICPPTLRPPDATPARPMRWVPANRQRTLEPWMYTRGERPRVCVTLGSMRGAVRHTVDYLCALVEKLLPLDVELVVAAAESVSSELRGRYPEIRADWVPMEFLVPTCDLVVHHNGGLTGLAAMNAGVPQVILNQWDLLRGSLRRLEEQGSGIVLHRDEETPKNVADACEKALVDPAYAGCARALSNDISALETPPRLVPALEDLAGVRDSLVR